MSVDHTLLGSPCLKRAFFRLYSTVLYYLSHMPRSVGVARAPHSSPPRRGQAVPGAPEEVDERGLVLLVLLGGGQGEEEEGGRGQDQGLRQDRIQREGGECHPNTDSYIVQDSTSNLCYI